MADLPKGAYRSGSLDAQIIYDENDLPIGFTRHGNDSYVARFSADGKNLVGADGVALALSQVGHRLVVLGDSIAIAGDTINSTNDQRYDSFSDTAAALSDGRIQFVRNAGVGGNTTAQLLARFDTDVTPWRPTLVFIICGTNDFTQGVSDKTYRTNIMALENKCRLIGAAPVFFTSPPVNSFGAGDVQRIVRNGIWLRRYANSRNMLEIDSFALSVDPATSGTWLSSLQIGDGIHPNAAGHQAWGQAAATQLNALLPQIKTGSYFNGDPLNLISNGLFQNGTTIATGFSQTWSPDAGTAAFSVISDASMPGGKAQRITLTSATGHAALSQIQASGWAVGDTLSMECDCNLAITGGFAHVEAVFTGSTGLVVCSSRRSVQGRTKFYREFVVPAGTTAIKFTVDAGYGASAVSGTCDFGALTVRNLTNPAGAFGNDGGSIATV